MAGDDLFTVVSEVYRAERRSKVLTKLPFNFFQLAEEYLSKQREEYSQAVLLPGNPKTMMLQDQIKKVEKRLKHIYEIRERKITLAALDSMNGSKPPENMTRKDKAMFQHIVETLKSFRQEMEPEQVPVPKITQTVQTKEPAQKPMESQAKIAPPEEPKPAKKDENMVVHVLEDIPSFAGPENTYELKKNDMATLPVQIANLLSSKGKVKIIDA